MAHPVRIGLQLAQEHAGSLVGGVSRAEVEVAFPGWEMLSVKPADTKGLGWPLNKTAPQWYRLRRQS